MNLVAVRGADDCTGQGHILYNFTVESLLSKVYCRGTRILVISRVRANLSATIRYRGLRRQNPFGT